MALEGWSDWLNAHPLVALLVVLTVGAALGALRWRNWSLGASGVLFAALAAGYIGVELPPLVADLGLVLFVYAVGLQAGPRFLVMFRRRGVGFLMVTLASLLTALGMALAANALFDLGTPLTTGLFAGSLASTPALAAARELIDDPAVAVGFGMSYPIGVVSVLLFIPLSLTLVRARIETEADAAERSIDTPKLMTAWFEVRNPLLAHRTVEELEMSHLADAVLSRVVKDGRSMVAQSQLTLDVGDYVRAVGREDELRRLEFSIGPRVPDFHEPPSQLATYTVVVTGPQVVGRTLAELQLRPRYGVTVTRLYRDDLEFIPHANTTLELGDTIRIAGDGESCRRVIDLVGHREERLDETQVLPLVLGVLLGVLLGIVAVPLGPVDFKLGLAGGPLFAGLLLGHVGRIGPVSFRMPRAARYVLRELGLALFMAGAGLTAGHELPAVLASHGLVALVAAVMIVWPPLLTALVLTRFVFRWDLLTSLGAICGAMTSTPGLGAVGRLSPSQASSLAYAAVYPAGLVVVILLTTLLTFLLSVLHGA